MTEAGKIAKSIMERAKQQASGIREEWMFEEIAATLRPLIAIRIHAKALVFDAFTDPANGWPKFTGGANEGSLLASDEVRDSLVAIRKFSDTEKGVTDANGPR